MKKITVDGIPRLCLFAVQDIKINEEVLYSYGNSRNYWWRNKSDKKGNSKRDKQESPSYTPDTEILFESLQPDVHPHDARTDSLLRVAQSEKPATVALVECLQPDDHPHEARSDSLSAAPSDAPATEGLLESLQQAVHDARSDSVFKAAPSNTVAFFEFLQPEAHVRDARRDSILRAASADTPGNRVALKTAEKQHVLHINDVELSDRESSILDDSLQDPDYVPSNESDEENEELHNFPNLLITSAISKSGKKYGSLVEASETTTANDVSNVDISNQHFVESRLVSVVNNEEQSANKVLSSDQSNLSLLDIRDPIPSLSHVTGSDRPSRPCPLCGKFKVRLTRHLRTVHKDDSNVRGALANSKKEQLAAFKLMKRAGIMKSNLAHIGSQEAVLQRERVTKTGDKRAGVVCTSCNGVFAKRCFYIHKRKCNVDSCFQAKGVPMPVFFSPDCQPTIFQTEILSHFRNDECGLLCQTEPTIKLIGCKLYSKINTRKDKKMQVKQTVMTDMRRLATLFIHFKAAYRRYHSDVNVSCSVLDMFCRKNFSILEEACASCTQAEQVHKSGLMVSLFYLLRKCARIIRVHRLKQDESGLAHEITEFLEVLDIEKNTLIGGAVYNNNNRRQVHLRKPQQLPTKEVLEQLRTYTLTRMKTMLQDPYLQWTSSEFAELRDLTCSRITLFNARRGGEPARLKLSHWNDALSDAWIDQSRVRGMSEEEKELFQNTKIMYQTGKGVNHLVPVLVLQDSIEALGKLADPDVRKICGVRHDNEFLFPSTLDSEGNVSGWHATQRVCNKAGVDSSYINATKMRHLASTMYASLDVPEDQRHAFYRHMGHSSSVNQNIYQAPLAELEILRVGSILRQFGESSLLILQLSHSLSF